MTTSSILRSWRIQCFKFGKRISGNGSLPAVTLGSVQKRTSLGCFHGSYLFKHFFWKLKSFIWKQKSTAPRFSYDLHSYSLNFDDGFVH